MITQKTVAVPNRIGPIHHFINLESDDAFTISFYFEVFDENGLKIDTQAGDEKEYIEPGHFNTLFELFRNRRSAIIEELEGNAGRCLWRLMDISQTTRTLNLRIVTLNDQGAYLATYNIREKANLNPDQLTLINEFSDLQRAKITNLVIGTISSEYSKNANLIAEIKANVVNPTTPNLRTRLTNYIQRMRDA